MLVILLAAGLLSLAFAGIAIKIWAKKDGEFAGTCAGNNPMLKTDGGSCAVCGAMPTEQCQKD
ncbi:MAG: membrane or secreted protein [Flavobacteriales bacterium]|jgi:rRNA maturation endonuclease Nob1|nr:membrane or secreted protein [Flavobacteriales bacterium]NCG29787.1 membrane or secreted protein [Bacteroidota bacterium]MBT3963917.1 membrane or secreted protein [Flavobacteriales bacterium]MBT4705341.1 membrane or secreted protein [Flavobacteriales bacterium]MBT4929908.1 membrane or secreted protein [Flavobacteriales bacterium]